MSWYKGDEYESSIQRNHVSKWTYRVEILGGKMEVLICKFLGQAVGVIIFPDLLLVSRSRMERTDFLRLLSARW